jgi:alkane 1-monooxygenase
LNFTTIFLTSIFVYLPTIGYLLDLPWLGLLVGAVIVPIAEWLIGPRVLGHAIQSSNLMRLFALSVCLQILGFSAQSPRLSVEEVFWLGLSMGYVSGGCGLVLAHELGHRHKGLDRWLSRALLALVGWGPYRIEHNQGHHRHAATFEDPATARAEESLYSFMPRYWRGIYVNGWNLSQLSKARTGWHEARTLTTFSFLLIVGLALGYGINSIFFWFIQALTAIFLVTAVDYIEHWGLTRKNVDREIEKISHEHIWDCANGVAEALLFNLPRHSHHHLAPSLIGHQLDRTKVSPQMPTGYAGMVLMASIPPLWFRIMRPRLAQYQEAYARN